MNHARDPEAIARGGPTRRPVVLDVGAEFDALDDEEEFFKKAGIDVVRCPGPDTSAGCPVLEGRPCPKVAEADVILCQLDLDTHDHRVILDSYRRHPQLVAVVSAEESLSWSDELRGVDIVIGPPSRSTLEFIANECARSPNARLPISPDPASISEAGSVRSAVT